MSESQDALALTAAASTAKPNQMTDLNVCLYEPVGKFDLPESRVATKPLIKGIGGTNAA